MSNADGSSVIEKGKRLNSRGFELLEKGKDRRVFQ